MTNENRRTSITFIPKAAQDLDELMGATGLNQNDVTNRAVQIYAFMQREFLNGKVLYLGQADGTDIERVHIV
jgi:hypothetical protein